MNYTILLSLLFDAPTAQAKDHGTPRSEQEAAARPVTPDIFETTAIANLSWLVQARLNTTLKNLAAIAPGAGVGNRMWLVFFAGPASAQSASRLLRFTHHYI